MSRKKKANKSNYRYRRLVRDMERRQAEARREPLAVETPKELLSTWQVALYVGILVIVFLWIFMEAGFFPLIFGEAGFIPIPSWLGSPQVIEVVDAEAIDLNPWQIPGRLNS